MLTEILKHLNNWFVVPDGVQTGDFDISGGEIALPFLTDGQYYRIVGSVFNDGVHKYGESLTDETFTGEIWALAIPKAVVELAKEIETWQEKSGGTSPYLSESFGGYSYTRSAEALNWQTAFRGRLNSWRKVW